MTKIPAEQRLQKVLAAAGVDSRRKCEELILDGAVRVNRKIVDTLPAFVDPEKDVIIVNGKEIRAAKKLYYLLNKPKGVICTNSDPKGRKKAIDIISSPQRIFCIGRLDIDSSGLIILTNDSELTNKLTHPKYKVAKTYAVTVKGHLSGESIEKLKKGIWLAEGKTDRTSVKILNRGRSESTLQMTVKQGMNRQIRRMLAKVNFDVKYLKRTQIGRLSLRGLGVGKFRQLRPSEVEYLKKLTNQSASPRKR